MFSHAGKERLFELKPLIPIRNFGQTPDTRRRSKATGVNPQSHRYWVLNSGAQIKQNLHTPFI